MQKSIFTWILFWHTCVFEEHAATLLRFFLFVKIAFAAKKLKLKQQQGIYVTVYYRFLRRFRDPIRVPRIRENYHQVPKIRENRVPRIRENYQRVPKIIENRVPRIREIGSLQIHTGHLTFSLKKPDLLWCLCTVYFGLHQFIRTSLLQ